MRIIIKGGVWKNTEDEILKAAVMKYGKNQWARISSLLVRKSAKQCKARWYEWLDPSIRKVEWSREEEEKLLHLSKLMPTQWRTIAQAMNGRTAAQCMEHYEKLLNAAQDKEGEEGDDPRKLRAGEIDPNPENKPARPDPIDMDEDEKEMLQEARARLANTKGKKAKRKIREKQLEEARRLASLQKRRELKAAGINVGRYHHKRHKGINYNEEIPFEHPIPAGFFDPALDMQIEADKAFKPKTLQAIDEQADRRRDREEAEARKKDKKKQELREKYDIPSAIKQINKANDPGQFVKRSKLSMPKPQLSETELEEIVRIQQQGGVPEIEDNPSTRTLLTDYTPRQGVAMTPARTPLGKQQALMDEARNLAILSGANTPLFGDENAPLASSAPISSASIDTRTPNPLATPGRGRPGIATPRGALVPGTPGGRSVRDGMSINTPITEETVSERERTQTLRAALASGLAQLPAPQNEYGAVMPEDVAIEDDEDDGPLPEEDAEEAVKRRAFERKRKEEIALKQRSIVLQRELPRPRVVSKQPAPQGTRTLIQQTEDLIKAEIQDMLLWDAFKYPVPGTKPARAVQPRKYADVDLESAKSLVLEELVAYQELIEDADGFRQAWYDTIDEFVFVPSQKRYVRVSAASRPDRVAALQHQFKLIRSQMVNDTKKAMKLEKKLKVTTGGYQKINGTTLTAIDSLHTEVDQARLELHCFSTLATQEAVSIERRVSELQNLVETVREQETQLQARYAELKTELGQWD